MHITETQVATWRENWGLIVVCQVTEVNTFMDNMELRGSINVQLQSEERQELQTVLIDLGSS